MTNREKLREMFPNTIFLYQKDTKNRTVAIICSDEWLDDDYDEQRKNEEKIRKEVDEIMRRCCQGREKQSFDPD
jgi:predicted phosphohydrolase